MNETERAPLHPIERKVLTGLGSGKALEFDSLVLSAGLLPDQVRRSLSWLSSKALVTVQETSTFMLVATSAEPPELLIVSKLEASNGSLPMSEL
jgi:hypothetical protein